MNLQKNRRRFSSNDERTEPKICRPNFHINRNLLPIKAIYFLFLSAIASLLPFLPVYYKQIGLSPLETGLLATIEPFVGALGKFVFNTLSDKLSQHKVVVVALILSSMLSRFAVMFLPTGLESAVLSSDMNVTSITGGVKLMEDWGSKVHECDCCLLNQSCLNEGIHDDFGVDCFKTVMNFSESGPGFNKARVLNCCRIQGFGNQSVTHCNESSSSLTLNRDSDRQNRCLLTSEEGCIAVSLLHGAGVEQENFTDNRVTEDRDLWVTEDTDQWSDVAGGDLRVTDHPGLSCNTSHCPEADDNDKSTSVARIPCSRTFIMLLGVSFIAYFCTAPILTHFDYITMQLCKKENVYYGRQRLWGAVGFGSVALIVGMLLDASSPDSDKTGHVNYAPSFILYVVFQLLTVAVASFMTFPGHTPSASILKDISKLLRNLEMILFLFVVLIMGSSIGVIMTFLFWHLDELGAPRSLLGMSLTITCTTEVPFMFFSGKLIKKIGCRRVLYVVMICYAIRLLGYSIINNSWYVLMFEGLHGVTYGAMWIATVTYADEIAPPGMGATLQGIVSATHWGFGVGVGSLLGGIIYQLCGARNLFRIYAGINIVTFIFYSLMEVGKTMMDRRSLFYNIVEARADDNIVNELVTSEETLCSTPTLMQGRVLLFDMGSNLTSTSHEETELNRLDELSLDMSSPGEETTVVI